MIRKLIVTLSLLSLSISSFANTCPSINEIKKLRLIGWEAYDSDEHTPLSPERLAQFKQKAQQFALAEWSSAADKNDGTVHCYYNDSNGSNLEAYFAKKNFIPQNNNQYWYQVSGFMHCAAGIKECQFKPTLLPKNQLANN